MMKRITILLAIILTTLNILVVEGQSRYYRKKQPKLGYGIKAGVNYAGQSTTNKAAEYNTTNILGINAGGYVNYFLLRPFAVQAELMVSGKGSHWQDNYDNEKDIVTYIDLPILLRYQPLNFLNIHAGPQIGLMLNAKQKDMETGIKININDYYQNFDYGFVFGAEANLPNNLNLTLRYIMGLFSATTDIMYVDPWKNNLIQISLGYRITGR